MASDKTENAKQTLPAPPLSPSGAMQAQPMPPAPVGPVDAQLAMGVSDPEAPPGRHNPAVSELVALRLKIAELEKKHADATDVAAVRERLDQLERGNAPRMLDARSAGQYARGGPFVARHMLVLGGPAKHDAEGHAQMGDRREITPGEAFDATPEELDGLVAGVHYDRAR